MTTNQMTTPVYHGFGKSQAPPFSPADRMIAVNRESSYHQTQNHTPKVEYLRNWFTNAGIPFVCHCYTGSGNLRFLHDKKKGRYFRWLQKIIQAELSKTNRLFITAVTQARLFRPFFYDPYDPDEWELSEWDYQMIADWLTDCFGSRAKDIFFVFPKSDKSDRGFETSLSLRTGGRTSGAGGLRSPTDCCAADSDNAYADNADCGYVPTSVSAAVNTPIRKARIDKITSEWLQALTVFLLHSGKTIKQILEIFALYGFFVAHSTLQGWAKKHGLNRRVGRPKTVCAPASRG